MNELITSALKNKDISPLMNFPICLLSTFEQDLMAWIMEYTAKYTVPPTVNRAKKQFSYFIQIESEPPLPLQDIFDITVKRKRKDLALSKLTNVIDRIQTEEEIPTDELDNLMRDLGISDSGVDNYSTFDRGRYFRKAGLKFGLPIIDHATGGISPGDLAIVSGRLGTGKSTIEQWLAYQWWLADKRILYVSNEMLPADVFSRIDGMVGRFNPRKLRTDTKETLEPTLRVVSSIAASSKGEIIIPARSISTVAQVSTLAKYLGVDVIIIDGIYLMQSAEHHVARWENVAAVSNSLKQAALDLKLPVLGSTQIKRVGGKTDYDPEDIAYSDALGQDADFLIALNPSKAVKQRIEVQLIKNRYGSQVTESIYIDYETMSIIDESVNGKVENCADEEFETMGGLNV